MGYGPVTRPILKTALCHTCLVVGQIPNTKAFWVSSPIVGSHLAGCVCLAVDMVGCVSVLEISSGLRGLSSQAFTLFGGGVYCLAPEAPLIRGMPTELKVFLAMLDAFGLRPCDQTHLKNSSVPYLSGGGTDDKYWGILSLRDALQEMGLDVGLLKKIVAGKKEFIGRS